jgi:hypothetical protein
MLNLIFTLDYEIHGNGAGSPYTLMVEPTRRLMRILERHGAKLTIMAEVAEIAQFKRYAAVHGTDRFHAGMIEEQLREAVRRSHDVQLHIHPAYDGARWEGERLELNWAEYDLAGLGDERSAAMIGAGKSYLERLLRPVAPDYACIAFRAGNWSMQPSAGVVRALRDQGLRIDTSVFKHGTRSGLVRFDYSDAFSELVPWPVDSRDVCQADPQGDLWEVPIYCENRWLWDFLSVARFYRIWQGIGHALPERGDLGAGDPRAAGGLRTQLARRSSGGILGRFGHLLRRHAWKLDFNQCSGRQLIGALKRIATRYRDFPYPLPVVLIGHSKLFTPYNESDLTAFLRYVAEHAAEHRFSTFGELEPEVMRKAFGHERASSAVWRGPKNVQPGTAQ